MAEPIMIRKNSMNCWNVLSSDRFTVFNPVKVMALTQRKTESVKLTLRAGVEAPQKMMAEMRHVKMK